MKSTSDDVAAAVGQAASVELVSALTKIEHCVRQLTDEQIWQRSSSSMNSIGNLILHLCGNLRQWIVSGLGGDPDTRHRPSEFSERGSISQCELLDRLKAVVDEASGVLGRLNAETLLAPRRIQGFDLTGVVALFDSVPHFRGHTQEIIHMTRELLGDSYQFQWQPQSPEQGAESTTAALEDSP